MKKLDAKTASFEARDLPWIGVRAHGGTIARVHRHRLAGECARFASAARGDAHVGQRGNQQDEQHSLSLLHDAEAHF